MDGAYVCEALKDNSFDGIVLSYHLATKLIRPITFVFVHLVKLTRNLIVLSRGAGGFFNIDHDNIAINQKSTIIFRVIYYTMQKVVKSFW
eukprot:7409613-Ditylum_brightwellii.AAC.1